MSGYRPRPLFLPLLFATALLWTAPSRAEIDAIEASLEELLAMRIVSAPKFAEDPDRIPSVVSILTADDIRRHGWRTIGDALRTLPGFNVTDDHTYAYAGVRGISQPGDFRPRLQILVDGLAINDNIFAGAPVDATFPVDIGLVERIEVIRGPSAAIYGGDAMFGVINVVTRGGSAVGGEVALAAGSGARRKLRVSQGGRVGDTDFLVSATGFRAIGHTLAVDDVNGDGSRRDLHRIDGEDGGQLFIKARGSDWHAALAHGKRRRVVPTASFDTIADDSGHTESDTFTQIDFGKEWRLDAANRLSQRFYAGDYRYDGIFPFDYSATPVADPRLINVDALHGSWWGVENRWTNTRWNGHRLTLGLEYRANWRQDLLNFDRGYGCVGNGGKAPCLDDRQRSRQFTLLVQDEIELGVHDVLTVGFSRDDAGRLGSFWSPRLGIAHDAGTAGLFKFLYGTAFRLPSAFERGYITPTQQYGNPDLDPEKLISRELSWEKRLGRNARLTSTLYHIVVDRMVSIDIAERAVNSSRVEAWGLDTEFQQQWHNGVRLRAGYALQYSSVASQRLDNSPRHALKGNLSLPTAIPDLSAGLEGQWIDARQADQGRQRVPSYTLVNLNFSYAAKGQPWELGLGIYNLFDRRYADPVDRDSILGATRWRIPQLGRTGQLRATLHF